MLVFLKYACLMINLYSYLGLHIWNEISFISLLNFCEIFLIVITIACKQLKIYFIVNSRVLLIRFYCRLTVDCVCNEVSVL